MLHMTKTLSTPTRPTRVSVPISPEALEAFERLAKAGNMSTGRAIAEWLNDTLDGVTYMAATMERARAAPKIVAAELHAYALGLADETGELMQKLRTMGLTGKGAGGAQATAALPGQPEALGPPSCNTGGKVTPKIIAKPTPKSRFPLPPAQVQAYADTNGKPPKGKK